MKVIQVDHVEIEIQRQTDPEAASQFMCVVSYQPKGLLSKEIISILLSDFKPIVRQTIDYGDKIVDGNSN